MEQGIVLLIAAGVVVLATSLLKGPLFPNKVKVAIATGVSVLAALVSVWLTGGLEATELLPASAQVFGISQLFYRFIFEGGRVDKKLESVGAKKTYDVDES